jgi:hypothetical protein
MHNQMQMLTTMMSQMQTSINRLTPEHGTQVAPSQHRGNGREFITPPPRPSSILSPIPEVDTPTPTPISSQNRSFPPNLGQFAPEQLPVPPVDQDARQKASMVPNPDSTSNTEKASSSSHQIIQHTNPTTQPQYYHQDTTFSPPQTDQQHQAQPNRCSPCPTNTYSQPRNVVMPSSHTYARAPPWQTPTDEPLHQQVTYNTNYQEPQLRTPHVELPLFSGDNPRAWILEAEDIFKLIGITGTMRVKWGIAHIRGQAKIWLSSSGLDLHEISWAELCKVLIERFPDTVTIDPMEQLQALKQHTTVDSYINEYESWMQVMKRGRTYLPQDFFVDRFISGLKEHIKHAVLCHRPEELLSAYWLARQQEKASNSNTLVVRRAMPLSPAPPNQQARNVLPRDNINRNYNGRPRVPRKCWYCPDNYTPGHRCTGMQRALNAVMMLGHSDEEDDPHQPLIEEILDQGIQPILAQQAPTLPVAPPPTAAGVQQDMDNIMHISAAAYTGDTTEASISLLIHLSGVPLVALADTGSTNTFLDQQFAMDHNVTMTDAPTRRVKVAGVGNYYLNMWPTIILL